MATPKKNPERYDFMKYWENLEKNSPVLETRWFVLEESLRWTDEYDSDHGGEKRRVSGYYETKEGAQGFIDKHDPDPGGTFHIASENLREYRRRWGI